MSVFITIICMWAAVEFGLQDQFTKKAWQWAKSWFKPVETESITELKIVKVKNGSGNTGENDTAQSESEDGSIQQPASRRRSRHTSDRDVEKG